MHKQQLPENIVAMIKITMQKELKRLSGVEDMQPTVEAIKDYLKKLEININF